jgi:RimJ/RimL family protein N-acetyltransferase
LLPEDWARLVEILAQHPRANATIDEPHVPDIERAGRWIDSRVSEERMGYALHWAICLLSNEELIGYVGLHDIDLERHHAELCFWLEPFPNSGEILLEAAQTALAFAFANLNMSSMRAVSTPDRNEAAELLAGIGMQLLQPAREKGTHWTRFHDVNIWTLTRHRWEKQLRISRHN